MKKTFPLFCAVLCLAALVPLAAQAAKKRAAAQPRAKLSAMALIPAGLFAMGAADTDQTAASNERPSHMVELDAFYIDRYEVTAEDYAKFLNAGNAWKDAAGHKLFHEINGPCVKTLSGRWAAAPGREKHPAVRLSWYGADAYCRWAGKRLPTEAEWEKAARGGTLTKWHFGDNAALLPQYAWHAEYAEKDTHPVGLKKPNQFGLYDMLGNAGEYVSDWFAEDYYDASATAKNPQGPPTGEEKVLRGRSMGGSAAIVTRSSARAAISPNMALEKNRDGFRCALTPPQQQ